MAAKAFGLFFLVLCTSGLVESIYFRFNRGDGRISHPWNLPPKFQERYFRDHHKLMNPHSGHDFLTKINFRNSYSYETSYENDLDSLELDNPTAYLTKEWIKNNGVSTNIPDSPISSKSPILQTSVKPGGSQKIASAEISSTSKNEITRSINAFNTERAVARNESNKISDTNLNSATTTNPLPAGNATVVDVLYNSSTAKIQNETASSLKNVSDSHTTKSSEENGKNETTTSTHSEGNSTDGVETQSTDSTNASITNESTSTDVTSVSYSSTTSDVIQTQETSSANSTSYATEGNVIQSTKDKGTTASKTEPTVTSGFASSTDETSKVPSTSLGFTESTRNERETSASETEPTVTSNLTLSTEEATFITTGFTESKPTGTEKEISEVIPEDHVIKIQSIRTARVIVSVVFIVIALVATVVLAIYMFRVKRRAVQYDELTLLP